MSDAPSERPLIEGERSLSQSSIWRYQRDFYEAAGAGSWAAGIVPHRVTTSPVLVHDYIRTLVAWLDDHGPRVDPSEPDYVIELGAGSGAFAQSFIAQWYGAGGPPHAQPVHYVVTDLVQSNLDVFGKNAHFQRAAALGQLSWAKFDACAPESITLHDGRKLLADAPKNPIVLVANYLFDTLPNDAFAWDGKLLREWRVALREGEGTPAGAALLEKLPLADAEYRAVPCARPFYGDNELDAVLDGELNEPMSFPFPNAGLTCMRFFADRTSNRVLLLSADKGFDEDPLPLETPPEFARHGSHSIMVNYGALRRFFTGRGGQTFTSPRRHFMLRFFVASLGGGKLVRTRWTFEDVFETFSVGDALAVERGDFQHRLQNEPNVPLTRWLGAIRLARFDTYRYLNTLEDLGQRLGQRLGRTESLALRIEIKGALDAVAANVHPSISADVALNVGLNLTQLGFYDEALAYFGESLAAKRSSSWRGMFGATLCLLGLGSVDALKETYQKAIASPVRDEERQEFEQMRALVRDACRQKDVELP